MTSSLSGRRPWVFRFPNNSVVGQFETDPLPVVLRGDYRDKLRTQPWWRCNMYTRFQTPQDHWRISSLLPSLRVALFTDCFHETNGVGTVCREYADHARRSGRPFFCAYGGEETRFSEKGTLQELELLAGG